MPYSITRQHLRDNFRSSYGVDAWTRCATLCPILPEVTEITDQDLIPNPPGIEPLLHRIRDQGARAAADLYEFTYGAQPCAFSALLFLGMWNAVQQCGLQRLNVLAIESRHNSIDESLDTWVDIARGECFVPDYCPLEDGDVHLPQYVRLFDLVLSAVCVTFSGTRPLVAGLRRRSTFVASRDYLTPLDAVSTAEPFVYNTVVADTPVVLGLGDVRLEREALRALRPATAGYVFPLGRTGPGGARPPGRPVFMVYDGGRWDVYFGGARVNALLDSSLFASMTRWDLYSVGGLKLDEVDLTLRQSQAYTHADFADTAARLAWVGREPLASGTLRMTAPLVSTGSFKTSVPSIDSLDGIIGRALDELAVAEQEQARLRRRAVLIRKHSPQTARMLYLEVPDAFVVLGSFCDEEPADD